MHRRLSALPYLLLTSADGTELMGERLVVQFARGTERPPRSNYDYPMQRAAPRPRRTVHRMTLNGLPPETSWQVSTLFS